MQINHAQPTKRIPVTVFCEFDYLTYETKTLQEIDNLIKMIQLTVTVKQDNFGTYKQKVTNYRQELFEQIIKIRKLYTKANTHMNQIRRK